MNAQAHGFTSSHRKPDRPFYRQLLSPPAVAAALLLGLALSTAAQPAKPTATGNTNKPPALELTQAEGSPMATPLSPTVVLNRGSDLKREWFVITDPGAPARISGPNNGVSVIYEAGKGYSSGDYKYSSLYGVETSEPLSAIEVRAHLFDVFGRYIRTLTATEVITIQSKFSLAGKWRLHSESEAGAMFTSVMYVANARTMTGKVYSINRQALLEQLKKVTSAISEADLDPPKASNP